MENFRTAFKNISESSDRETLKHFLFRNAYDIPDKPAFEWENSESGCVESITYSQLAGKIIYIGTAFYDMGLEGKTIALAGRTGINWLLIFVTALCSNITVVPLDYSLPEDQLTGRIKHCEASLLIKDKDIVADENMSPTNLKIMDTGDIDLIVEKGKRLINDCNADSWTDGHLSQKQIGMMIFTSGTGGKMKAAMLRQENLTLERFVWKGIEADRSKCLVQLPLFHIAGIKDLYGSMMTGATAYLSSGFRYMIEEFNYVKPRSCFVVPAQASLICALLGGKSREEGRRLLGSNIVSIRTSGAPLPENLRGLLADYDISVTSDYGMTETGGPVSVSVMKDGKLYSKQGSAGHILDQIEVRIGDPDEKGCGEILISGQCVFEGYYRDEEETRKILKDDVLHTGDIGYIDDDRYLYIVGRKKNIIIRENGINIIPEELERNILAISGVNECLVYQDGESIAARIYAGQLSREAKSCIKKEIDAVNRAQPYYKRIDIIEFMDNPLPKTATGKIRR